VEAEDEAEEAAVTPDLAEALRPLVAQLVAEELERRAAAAPAEYLTIEAAAAVASVSVSTVRRWLRSGRLAERRVEGVIRIERAELEAVLGTPRRRVANANLTPAQRAARDFG
jgi:excisionase family DNA binding protein